MGTRVFSKPLERDVEVLQDGLKVGEIKMFSGSTAPAKWKVCDGSVISRTVFANLFGIIGTSWGGGDGETTFAIPDYQGRTPIGVGESSATGHTAHTLGQYAGEETHVLIVDELPTHYHGYQSSFQAPSSSATTSLGNAKWTSSGHENTMWWHSKTANTGTDTAHNTMQPFAACTFIIYTGVDETP